MKKILLFLSLVIVTQSYSQSSNSGKMTSTVCDSVNTLYAYTYLNHGAMFNVVAKTNNVTIDHLNANIKNGTVAYSVYYKTGSFLGFEIKPSAWTLIGSVNVASNNTLTINNLPTVIPINLNITMNMGDTVAFYLVSPVLSKVYLTATTTPWETEYIADTAISISVARSVYQLFGVPFSTPQIWNGSVSYCTLNTVGLETIADKGEHVTIYSSDGQLTLQLPQELLNANKAIQLQIADVLSRKVVNYKVNSTSLSINTSDFTPGVYFCLVTDQSGVLKQQKIVIR